MPRTPGPHDNLIGAATIILTLVGWSSIPLFLKHFTHSIDAWTANGWRYAFSALLWLPVLILGAYRKSLPPGLWKAALWPSVFNTVAQICFALAPYYIDPGLMTFSLRIHIVFVTVGAAILFAAERRVIRTPWFLAGVTLVLLGAAGTVALNPSGLGGGTAVGVALSVGSGFLYAAYSLAVRHFMHGVNSLQAFAAISQYTAVGVLIPMFIWGGRGGLVAFDLASDQMVLLLLSAVIGIGLGHTLYYISMARLGLAVSAGVVQLQPVFVSAASFFMFDERLTLWQWVAGGAAIFGAGLILYAQQRLKPGFAEGLCQTCGYDLIGLSATVCPECGSLPIPAGHPARSGESPSPSPLPTPRIEA